MHAPFVAGKKEQFKMLLSCVLLLYVSNRWRAVTKTISVFLIFNFSYIIKQWYGDVSTGSDFFSFFLSINSISGRLKSIIVNILNTKRTMLVLCLL